MKLSIDVEKGMKLR